MISGGPNGLRGGTGRGLRLAPGAASATAKVVQTEQLSVKLFDNKKMPVWDGTDFVGKAPGFENLMMTYRVWGYFDGAYTWSSDPGEQYVYKENSFQCFHFLEMLQPDDDRETIQQFKTEADSAHHAWQYLLRRHWQIREDDVYQLEADLAKVSMEAEEVADTYLRKGEKMVARLATFGVHISEAKLVWYIVNGLHESYREVKHQWRAHQDTNNPLSLPHVVDLIKTTPVSSTPPVQHLLTSPSTSSTSLSSLLSTPLLEANALQRRTQLTPEQFAKYCSMQTCHRCGQRGHIQRQCISLSPGASSYAGTHGAASSAGNPPVGPFGIGTLRSHPSHAGDGARCSSPPLGEYRGSPGGGDGHPPYPAGTRQF